MTDMARFNTRMTKEKYMSEEWPGGKMDWLALESDIRVVLRDYFARGSGRSTSPHLDYIDWLLEYYTGRGSENRGG
jgi:hypothetical protein